MVIIRGIVDRIEEDQIIVLVGDEGFVWSLPRAFLPNVAESDLLSFDIKQELPAEEVRKMLPKELMLRLSWCY